MNMKLIKFLKSYPFVESTKHEKKSAKPKVEDRLCCPFCGEPLVKRGQKRLQTLEEHVYDPNMTPSLKDAMYCENTECENGKYFCWNGGRFGGEAFMNSDTIGDDENAFHAFYKASKEYYINALNSAVCQSERSESWFVLFHPALTFGAFRPYVEVLPSYKENGEFVRNRYKTGLMGRDKNGKYCIMRIGGLHMFLFSIKQRSGYKFRGLKALGKDAKLDEKQVSRLSRGMRDVYGYDAMGRRAKHAEWWRTASEKYMRIFHPFVMKRCLKTAKNSLYAMYGEERGEIEYKYFIDEVLK